MDMDTPKHPTLRFQNMQMKQYLSHVLASVVFLSGLCGTDSALALLINIDFDQSIAERRPSDDFGAASGQTGVWNQVRLGSSSNLLDVNGNVTSVEITVSAFTDSGQAFFPTNDAQRLLNDNFLSGINAVPSDWAVTITGLPNTANDLFLYAPTNSLVSTGLMTVNGMSLTELLGNDLGLLVEGESWIAAQVEVAGGTLSITGTSNGGSRAFAGLAGLQLVPEPGTLALLCLGFVGIASSRLHLMTKFNNRVRG
jgi:hypothetical protein